MASSVSPNEAYARQQALVEKLIQDGNLTDPRVEAAFRDVPRHLFLPHLPLEEAYRDDAIPTKRLPTGEVVSSSSQPAIMAIMLEQLALEPGQCVLEIGAGTGYNAALITHIIGKMGRVISVDIDEDIVEAAREHLSTAGYSRTQVVRADGALGYPQSAPYDRIILTVAAWDIAPAWREQLKPDGRLLLPLDVKGSQKSVAFQPEGNHLVSISARACAFMGLRGAFAAPNSDVAFGAERTLRLSTDAPVSVSPDALYALLDGPSREFSTQVEVTHYQVFDSLSLWLGIREPRFARLWGEGDQSKLIPPLFELSHAQRATFALLGNDSLCALVRLPAASPTAKSDGQPNSFTLMLRLFGPDEALADRLIRQVSAWDAAGRPGTQDLRIRAYPRDENAGPAEGAFTVEKRWSRLALDWGT